MVTLIIILYILCVFGIAGIDSITRKDNESVIVNLIFYILFAWLFPFKIMFAIGKFCAYIDNIIENGEKKSTWNKEDEKIYKNIIDYFNVDNALQYKESQVIVWLQSIKKRIKGK